MSLPTRYALWLVPEDAAEEQLQSVINELAGHYSAPSFVPHMTLLGRVTGEETGLTEKLTTLAAALSPIPGKLTGFAGAPYYFRCFFSPVESSSEMRQAISEASHVFDASTGSDHNPHISLLYGQLDREEKKTIPALIGDKVPRNILFNKLRLIRMSVSVSGWETIAEADITG